MAATMNGARFAGLPHAEPALLIEHVVARESDRSVCHARIGAASPFVSNGRAPAIVALEAAAQAAATLPSREEDVAPDARARAGYLVRVRDVVLERDDLPAGATLVVTARRTGGSGGLGVFDVEVRLDGALVLAGSLTTIREGFGGP
jgi:predicted hotdog family 3-hydroxylacyl-ACP dehydratase